MRNWFQSLWILGLVTLIIFPLISWPVWYFADMDIAAVFSVKTSALYSIPTFLSAGILFGLLMIWLTEQPYFEQALSKFKNLLSNFKLNWFHVIFLSVCAGVGEEIFFRGALQPLLGIVPTAVFFVAIHGYYSMKEPKVNIFALFLTLFIVFLGWGAKTYSLYHAIAGHFSYDLVLLAYYKRTS